MATALKEKMVRISTSPLKEDDFTFTLDGVSLLYGQGGRRR